MGSTLSRLILGAVASVLAVGEARAASRLYPQAFKDGIEAQDFGHWDKSAELMRQALLEMPEDGADVRIYGEKYRSYLPHYYLGLVFFKKNHCAEAVAEWDKSLELGAVRRTEELKALQSYHARCLASMYGSRGGGRDGIRQGSTSEDAETARGPSSRSTE